MEITLDTSAGALKQHTGDSSFVNNSGMHDVIIKHFILRPGNDKAESFSMIVEKDGKESTIFGAYNYKNLDGQLNKVGVQELNRLMVTLGFTEAPKSPKSVTVKAWNGLDETVLSYTEFDNLPVTLFIKKEYYLRDNEIKERSRIVAPYRTEDKASPSEIGAIKEGREVEVGNQYEADLIDCESDILLDKITPEMVAEYIENKRAGKKQKTKASSSTIASSRYSK